MMNLLLVALVNTPMAPTFDIVDSKDDPSITYVIVNNICKVKVKKAELKDADAVVSKVEKECGVSTITSSF